MALQCRPFLIGRYQDNHIERIGDALAYPSDTRSFDHSARSVIYVFSLAPFLLYI